MVSSTKLRRIKPKYSTMNEDINLVKNLTTYFCRAARNVSLAPPADNLKQNTFPDYLKTLLIS